MYQKVLFLLDLEGVNLVVGQPYEGLVRDCEQWQIARAQATKEVNAAAQALFAVGVEVVALWDNHGAGKNIDVSLLDKRIRYLDVNTALPRMSFAANGAFDAVCFFGYHAMEGTLGGVLAHTMSSKTVQHYKLNGVYIGEVDIDAAIAASYGMPTRFFAAGDIACRQASRVIPDVVSVVTKKELARNKAVFRDNEALLAEIQEKIVLAVRTPGTRHTLSFPLSFEKSFKRVEDAAKYFERLRAAGIAADYLDDEVLLKDAHTVVSTVNDMDEFIRCI